MHIIKLNATDSTNDYLKQLATKKELKNFTVVITKTQSRGRGQMGSVWISEDYKNLTFSILVKSLNLKIEDRFYLSMATSLAIVDALKPFQIKRLGIKWPNDILAGNKKIGGILIENILKGPYIESSIIGIGLNVNQIAFTSLPHATSLKNLTGINYELDALLSGILKKIKVYLKQVQQRNFISLKRDYELELFRKNKPSTFEDESNYRFTAYIQGVTEAGKLSLMLEDNIIKTFDLKEIRLLY